ncbi:MAG: precorrin-8X methylmutase [Desulfuromonas sp.]|nr:MAG: precorrin-8X methylmutase [Desulfuromonas sp.]
MADVILRDPSAIEAESFTIIDREAQGHGFDAQHWPIVRRVIHTSADFDFIQALKFSPEAVENGMTALRGGARIYADTNMIVSGVGKARLAKVGASIACHVADADVAEQARAEGVTRSIVALRKGVAAGAEIFLIGNAPTALYELLRLTAEGEAKPKLVVGVPVGFVGAAESKQALLESGLPSILALGRKGGSTIAVAICNQLLIEAGRVDG